MTRLSLVWRLVAATALFASSTTISLAAPYGYQYQSGGVNPWGRAARFFSPANQQPSQFQAMAAPIAAPRHMDSASDYMPAITEQGTFHWENGKMPIKVFIGNGQGVPSYRPQYGSFIRKGFDEWCRISNGKLAWVEVTEAAKADVTVAWTIQVNQRPEGTEAGKTDAYTRYNTATGQGVIYGAKMQFLTKLPGREFTDLEVEKTCLHEVGHAMGLQGHSPYRNDIMFYAVQPTQAPALTARDVNTLNRLYASYPVLDAMTLKAQQQSAVVGN